MHHFQACLNYTTKYCLDYINLIDFDFNYHLKYYK